MVLDYALEAQQYHDGRLPCGAPQLTGAVMRVREAVAITRGGRDTRAKLNHVERLIFIAIGFLCYVRAFWLKQTSVRGDARGSNFARF